MPWGHNVTLLEKLSDPETRLHERSGRAISDFKAVLPAADSDLLQQTMKDPYIFDFVAMTDRHNEGELEAQLVDHVEKSCLSSRPANSILGIGLLLCKTKNNVVAEYALH